MKIFKILMIFSLIVFANNVAAYGSSSSSKKACKKPKFSQFTPANLSEVAPQSEFSFVASSITLPESIQVTIKNEPIVIAVNKKNSGYVITGKLPDSLSDTHARINIQAKGPKNCKGKDGWLLKIVSK